MTGTWVVLVPPIIVLVCAFVTRKLNLALAVGLASATLIATNFSVPAAGKLAAQQLIGRLTDIDNLYMYAFLLMIGTVVALMSATGGAYAFAHTITKKLRTAKMVESSSILLSMALFIDDYLSNLTTGYVMRPLTDRFKIPRAKLAFLVHSLSGPFVILIPISSWVAFITSTLDEAGIGTSSTANLKIAADPFFVYLNAIPFIFYSFLLIASVWFIVRRRISFGPMYQQEKIAQETGNLFGGKKPPTDKIQAHQHANGSIADLLLPLAVLIGTVMIGIPYTGGYYLFGGPNNLLDAFKNNTDTFFVLFVAGVLTLAISFAFSLARKTLTINQVPKIIKQGIELMLPPVIMVFLAATLSEVIKNDLQTGQYLASLFALGSLSINLLPCMFFVVSVVASTMTGTSWGTILVMLPIAIPMITSLSTSAIPAAPEAVSLLFPVLGAIFSGAVCGDHISPISETTIMAATSTGSYPVDHTQTQFPYAAPAMVCSAISFLIAGQLAGSSAWIVLGVSLGVGMVLCLGSLQLMNYLTHKKAK